MQEKEKERKKKKRKKKKEKRKRRNQDGQPHQEPDPQALVKVSIDSSPPKKKQDFVSQKIAKNLLRELKNNLKHFFQSVLLVLFTDDIFGRALARILHYVTKADSTRLQFFSLIIFSLAI